MAHTEAIPSDAMPPASQLVNDHEAAVYLGLSVMTLRKWRVEGRGPKFYRFGRSIRYAIADLDDFRDRNQVTPWDDTQR